MHVNLCFLLLLKQWFSINNRDKIIEKMFIPFFLLLFYVWSVFLHIFMYILCMCHDYKLQKSEEFIWSPTTGDKKTYVLPCWRSILSSLEEKSVLLADQLFLQNLSIFELVMLTSLWSFTVITDTNHDAWIFVSSEESNSGPHE